MKSRLIKKRGTTYGQIESPSSAFQSGFSLSSSEHGRKKLCYKRGIKPLSPICVSLWFVISVSKFSKFTFRFFRIDYSSVLVIAATGGMMFPDGCLSHFCVHNIS